MTRRGGGKEKGPDAKVSLKKVCSNGYPWWLQRGGSGGIQENENPKSIGNGWKVRRL